MDSILTVSVVICTHNPKQNLIQRTVSGLIAQSHPKNLWELIIVDNASHQVVDSEIVLGDKSWREYGENLRIVVEPKLGLTHARIRGIEEARANLILFVDDDNILEPNYLKQLVDTKQAFPCLGAIGAGIIEAEYEVEPSKDLEPFMPMLALRASREPKWSNLRSWNEALPYGAGMCIDRDTANAYIRCAASSEVRQRLDRSGGALLSGGDIDIALSATLINKGYGVFPELKLTHIIPSCRLEKDYLAKLAEGHAFSYEILAKLWGFKGSGDIGLLSYFRHFKKMILKRGLDRLIYLASRRGTLKAGMAIRSMVSGTGF